MSKGLIPTESVGVKSLSRPIASGFEKGMKKVNGGWSMVNV